MGIFSKYSDGIVKMSDVFEYKTSYLKAGSLVRWCAFKKAFGVGGIGEFMTKVAFDGDFDNNIPFDVEEVNVDYWEMVGERIERNIKSKAPKGFSVRCDIEYVDIYINKLFNPDKPREFDINILVEMERGNVELRVRIVKVQ